jgi:hypothetical protein
LRAPARPKPAASGWTFEATPYGWFPWVSGDAVIKGRSFTVEENPWQVLESLKMVYMGYMQAKNGPLTLFNDTIYADLGSSGSLVRSKTFSPHINATVGAALNADYRYWTVEGGAMYEVMTTRDTAVEVLAGGRYWHQELDVDVSLAGTVDVRGLIFAGNRAIAKSGTQEWVDPFIGARLRYVPAAGEEIAIRGDIGGFGAASKFTWQALATYNWLLCVHGPLTIDGYVGWRALSVDYETGEGHSRYEFDVLQHGPVLGLTGRF